MFCDCAKYDKSDTHRTKVMERPSRIYLLLTRKSRRVLPAPARESSHCNCDINVSVLENYMQSSCTGV